MFWLYKLAHCQIKLTLINLLLWSLSLRTLDPQGSFALSIMAEAAIKKKASIKKLLKEISQYSQENACAGVSF